MPRRAVPFWDRVKKTDGCWLWTGGRTSEGYGCVRFHGRTDRAHRVAYEMTSGPIRPGLCVCHRCDNPICVRPSHLFLGTNRENAQDRHAKGRTKNLDLARAMRGDRRYWTAKLSAAQVRAIRDAVSAGEQLVVVGRRFGVHHSTVSRIARRLYRTEVA